METLTKQEIKHYIIVNLSYSLTHKLLKEKIYSQVVRNITKRIISTNDVNIKYLLKSIINNANRYNLLHYLLKSGFLWSQTPEKFNYWDKLFKKYYNENY